MYVKVLHMFMCLCVCVFICVYRPSFFSETVCLIDPSAHRQVKVLTNEHHGPHWLTSEHHGPHWLISEHHGPHWLTSEHMVPSAWVFYHASLHSAFM